MKYNSIHRFAHLKDAHDFVSFIKDAGFFYAGCDKDGGVIYKNEKGHTLMVLVQP